MNSVSSASDDSSTAAANAASVLYSLYADSTNRVSVCVLPRMLPLMTDTAPNSPMARALVRMVPYSRPHLMLGSVTFQNTCQSLAPSDRAASSCDRSMVSRMGMSSRTTKGSVTNMVASAMPPNANTTLTPPAASAGPNQPLRPYSSVSMRPVTTGEMEKGRSSSDSRNTLPGNSLRVMLMAATSPKMTLMGTDTSASSSVSLTACRKSGSSRCSANACTPLPNACTNTLAKGMSTMSAMYAMAAPTSSLGQNPSTGLPPDPPCPPMAPAAPAFSTVSMRLPIRCNFPWLHAMPGLLVMDAPPRN
mmetsp:Transcript_32048/g.81457  ORF Transcript_32048/g.81457 Transcript_32048/m.81457 type:complete len:305 (+) Transcript_32048:532-1446(+)